MPLFFLHIYDNKLIEDPEGSEMANLEEAVAEARASLREIVIDRLRAHRPIGGQEIRICDEAGEVLAVVPYAEAVKAA